MAADQRERNRRGRPRHGLEDDRLRTFPGPDELWLRHRAWKGLVDDSVAEGFLMPFNPALRNANATVKEPRYYQRTAINRSVEAILRSEATSACCYLGQPRLLPGTAGRAGQLDLFGKEIPAGLYTTRDFERVMSLLTRTEAAAKRSVV